MINSVNTDFAVDESSPQDVKEKAIDD